MKIAPVKVVDTSAVAALLFQEPSSDQVMAKLAGAKIAAPGLLRYEIANVARKKTDKYGLSFTQARQCMSDFSNWEFSWYEVPPSKCLETSEVTGLSAYDSAYCWLAQELEAELVTLDERMSKAAKRLGSPE